MGKLKQFCISTLVALGILKEEKVLKQKPAKLYENKELGQEMKEINTNKVLISNKSNKMKLPPIDDKNKQNNIDMDIKSQIEIEEPDEYITKHRLNKTVTAAYGALVSLIAIGFSLYSMQKKLNENLINQNEDFENSISFKQRQYNALEYFMNEMVPNIINAISAQASQGANALCKLTDVNTQVCNIADFQNNIVSVATALSKEGMTQGDLESLWQCAYNKMYEVYGCAIDSASGALMQFFDSLRALPENGLPDATCNNSNVEALANQLLTCANPGYQR